MATLTQQLQHLLENKNPLLPIETKRILLKEALQAYTLDFVYNHPDYRRLNFYGGTCLHLLHGLNRLSEDLDFDHGDAPHLERLGEDIQSHFQKLHQEIEITAKTQKGAGGIQRVTLRFPVLYTLGLSPNPTEALHMKIEISHHTQVAVIHRTPVLTFGRSLVARHFSIETMMAGKMLACLERSFLQGRSGVTIIGRDFYDLLWFMQKRIWPLEEKLAKDGKQAYTVNSAMQALQERVAQIKTRDLALDLLPLFEQRTFIDAWLETFHDTFHTFAGFYL